MEHPPKVSSDKPLKMAVCSRCGTRYFVADPRPGPYLGDMHIHDAAPPSSKGREVVPINCPACGHQQFAEFYYGS